MADLIATACSYVRRLHWIGLTMSLLVAFMVAAPPPPAAAASPSPQPTKVPIGVPGTPHRIQPLRRLTPSSLVPRLQAAVAPPSAQPVPYRYDNQSPTYPFIPNHGATAINLSPGIRPNTTGGLNFQGQGPVHPYLPGDPSAAFGPSDLVQTVNEQLTAFTLSGSAEFTRSLQSFFNTSSSASVTDTHVLYDPGNTGHFLVLALDSTDDYLDLAVSQGNDAYSSQWCFYYFPTTAQYSPDFPEFGIDSDVSGAGLGLFFTDDLFNADGSFAQANLYEADRVGAESCGGITYYTWFNIPNPDGTRAYAIAPAITRQGTSTTEWLVDSYANGGASLNLFKVDTTPTLWVNISVPTSSYARPSSAGAPEEGTSATLALGDCRVVEAAFDGYLETSLTSSYDWGGGNVNTIISWRKIDTSNLTVYQQGGFGAAGYWLFNPAMMPDSSDRVTLVWTDSGPSTYPSAWMGGLDANGIGTSNVPLAMGNSPYGTGQSSRWGDFSWAVPDPGTASQIDVTADVALNGDWATWLGSASQP